MMLTFCIRLLCYNSNSLSLNLHCFLSNRKVYCHFRGFGWVRQRCKGVVYLSPSGHPLILVYSWARPAVLAAGMEEGQCFYFFCVFTFIHFPLSPLSLSFISSTIYSISSPFSGRRHKMTHKDWRVVNPNTINVILQFFSPLLNIQKGGAYVDNYKS